MFLVRSVCLFVCPSGRYTFDSDGSGSSKQSTIFIDWTVPSRQNFLGGEIPACDGHRQTDRHGDRATVALRDKLSVFGYTDSYFTNGQLFGVNDCECALPRPEVMF